MTLQIRGPYSPREREQLEFPENSGKTHQSFKEQCDVNNIVARHATNGGPVWMHKERPQYIDCSDIPDYQAAQNAVIQANNAFMSLPAKLRQRFNNDPHDFVTFATDPQNLDQMIELGLAPPKPPENQAVKPTETSGGTD